MTNSGDISRLVAKLGYTEKDTPWGKAKCLTEQQVEDWNKQNGN